MALAGHSTSPAVSDPSSQPLISTFLTIFHPVSLRPIFSALLTGPSARRPAATSQSARQQTCWPTSPTSCCHQIYSLHAEFMSIILLGQAERWRLQRLPRFCSTAFGCLIVCIRGIPMTGYTFCFEDPRLTLQTPQILESWTSLLILCCVSVSTPIVTYPIIPFSIFSPSSGTIWRVGSQPLAVSEA